MGDIHIHCPEATGIYAQRRLKFGRRWLPLSGTLNDVDRAKEIALDALAASDDTKAVRVIQTYEYYEPLTVFEATRNV